MDIFTGEKLIELIKLVGYFGVFGMVFSETGLLIGVFLPGDSLLFTAGLLASQGFLNIYILLPVLFVAAVIGDNVGYWFGHKMGDKIFSRQDSKIFHKDNVLKAQKFYDKYGPMTIILSRYIPIVRTFAPLIAGVGKMEYKRFFWLDMIGCLIWSVGLTLAGFYLVKIFPGLDKYLTLVVLGIVVLSVIPPIYHYLKEKFQVKS
ncbi:MAG: VTT domain-containing protein [Candidatus Berkelbacteria bacterium]